MTKKNAILKKNIRALGLFSGGLDSIIAVKIIQRQGIEVTGLSFVSPFFGAELAKNIAKELNISLIIEDFTVDHFEIVKNPPHGYGKSMNPCIDCHALMFKRAGRFMEQNDFDFIFTGEVLNERPMSQNRQSLHVVAKISGYEKFIVRPLSAKLLEETELEKQGLLDREALLDIQGRSRKKQILLAEELGLSKYPNPAGGCLLTDQGFSRRLKELLEHNKNPTICDLKLLRFGRHFRISNDTKLIVGRNEQENGIIEKFIVDDSIVLKTESIPGPVCLLIGLDASKHFELAARICASYSDSPEDQVCVVNIEKGKKDYKLNVFGEKTLRKHGRIN